MKEAISFFFLRAAPLLLNNNKISSPVIHLCGLCQHLREISVHATFWLVCNLFGVASHGWGVAGSQLMVFWLIFNVEVSPWWKMDCLRNEMVESITTKHLGPGMDSSLLASVDSVTVFYTPMWPAPLRSRQRRFCVTGKASQANNCANICLHSPS